ncbi:MAG: ATP-dependent DNA helicase RecG [Clostridiales bacterium GWB2_37_7]|nr:MAG: ATP-dependent DNA helicase RecG [Clostridiales bacterium GWB2_37_7]
MIIQNIPIQSLKGIGPAKSKLFHKLGIKTVENLLYHYPRGYKDKSIITDIRDLLPEYLYTIRATVDAKPLEIRSKKGVLVIKLAVSDETGGINIVWFNNRFIKNNIKQGDELFFYGKVKQMGKDLVMESPEFEKTASSASVNLLRIVPEYPLTEGLTHKDIRKAVFNALELTAGKLTDIFPEDFRKRYQLSEINFCVNNLHFPETMFNMKLAVKRFKFEELFILQSGLIHIKRMYSIEEHGIVFKEYDERAFLHKLPFQLTNAQLKVVEEIFIDMEKNKPMNRLVQGDVGSGKTIVALLAMYKCTRNGFQSLMMVPTEILAEQHYLTFKCLLEGTGIRIELLKGSMSAKEKNAVLQRVNNHEADIIIGTHALIQDKVEFAKVGLVITDEQHRFGVRQRTALSDKGSNPDIMVMTATPIPRTLTLIFYGDLDVSLIDELPPGRKKIETYFIDSSKKERFYDFVKKELDQGRQAYFVCPLVEESEKLELNSATKYRDELQNKYFKGYNVGLLHGKMKADEKNLIMEDMRQGKIHILVATTVIEVGVNIPNATIMAIENADRFGLAQLHQLRGRVGRGEHQSYCILVSDTDSKIAVERLKYMTKSENGFDIAEKDLELRGAGEVLGQKQHGLPELKIADILNDTALLKLSRDAVEYLYDSGKLDEPEYQRMKKELDARFNRILEEIALN